MDEFPIYLFSFYFLGYTWHVQKVGFEAARRIVVTGRLISLILRNDVYWDSINGFLFIKKLFLDMQKSTNLFRNQQAETISIKSNTKLNK